MILSGDAHLLDGHRGRHRRRGGRTHRLGHIEQRPHEAGVVVIG
jgi:hypothetical protein